MRRAHGQKLNVAWSVSDRALRLLRTERAISSHEAVCRRRANMGSPAALDPRDFHTIAFDLCAHVQQQFVVEVTLCRVRGERAQINTSSLKLAFDDVCILPYEAAVFRVGERRPRARRKELLRVIHQIPVEFDGSMRFAASRIQGRRKPPSRLNGELLEL